MSQATNGRLIASQRSVRLEGVWDQPPPVCAVLVRLLCEDSGEGSSFLDVVAVVVDAALRGGFDGDEKVGSREVDARFDLEDLAGEEFVLLAASSGAGYSEGCRLVATILYGVVRTVRKGGYGDAIERLGCWIDIYRGFTLRLRLRLRLARPWVQNACIR